MNTDNVTTVSEMKFSQSNKVVHEIPISKPQVKSTSKIVHVEDALNNTSNEEYTYITKIKTDVGYNYYGVKRLPFFIYDDCDEYYSPKEKNNINANVVVLTPSSKQMQIYSFKNGAQYAELSNSALALAQANNGKLIPHYIYSYEYMIDGDIPDNDTTYNLKFYGSVGYISNASSLSQLCPVDELCEQLASADNKEEFISNLLSYSFSVPYTRTFDTPQETQYSLSKVKKTPNIRRIDTNITEASENSAIYEPVFTKIAIADSELISSYLDAFDIYEKNISYVQLDNKLVTANDIVQNSSKQLDNEYEGQNVFYSFDKKTSTYVPITTAKTSQNSEQIFAKCISYVKVASNLKLTQTSSDTLRSAQYYSYTELPRYLQEFEYIEVDKNQPSQKSLYYIPKEIKEGINAYYPIQAGIVSDGSIEYYGLTYVALSDERLKAIQENEDGIYSNLKIYIKQEYTPKDDTSELSDYDIDNLYTYEGNSIIYEESIGNNDYIFDLDISGNTIYAKTKDSVTDNSSEEEQEQEPSRSRSTDNENENTEESEKIKVTPISKEDIEKIYFSYNSGGGIVDDWSSKNRKEETVTNRLYRYSLPANYEIGSKIDYNGKWNKIDLKVLKDMLKSDEEVNAKLQELKAEHKLFIKQEGYNEISIDEIVVGYDVNFYVWEIGKINSSDIEKINDDSEYYIDVTKYTDEDTEAIVNSDQSIKLMKINKYGFVKNDAIEYYTREPIKEISRDLYFFNEKDYYARIANGNVDSNTTIQTTETGATPIIPLGLLKIGDPLLDYGENPTQHIRIRNDIASMLIDGGIYSNLSYRINENSSLYKVELQNEISYESAYYISASIKSNGEFSSNIADVSIDLLYDNSYDFDWDSIQYYKDKISHYILSKEYDSASYINEFDNKYLYSKYFYPNLTINNGIHQAKDGSYYTSISVFDGTRGTISKSLFLQPNVFNVTEYTYEYNVHALIEVDLDANLTTVTENHYKDYYISQDGEMEQLNSESKSPTYYQNWFTNKSGDNRIYTYKDKTITAKYDGRSVGPRNAMQIQYFDNATYEPKIVNKDNVLFGIIFNSDLTKTGNEYKDSWIVDPYTNLFVSPMSSIDPVSSYEYTVVKLKEDIIEEETTNDVWQNEASYVKEISVKEPFYLANEKTIEFTGTYHWNLPEHKYVFKGDESHGFEAYDIITNSGYWEKEYKEKTIPFIVASYNFYSDPNEVSSTTASYNFIPDSKVVTAVINHPNISYKYVVRESNEVARFSYIFEDGKEYNYPSTSKVQVNDDGTYSGVITTSDGLQKLVELRKHIVVDTSPVIQTITHQKAYTSFEYSSYKTSIALANEKKPVLYNIELIPAKSHKVLYWNEDAESYAIKTVVDTNAYYAYNYWYETVPFVTETYIMSNNELKVAYISEIGYAIGSMSESIDNIINGATGSFSSLFTSVDSVASYLNELKETQSNVLPSLGTTIENAVNSLNESLTTVANSFQRGDGDTSGSYINTYDIYTNIENQTQTIDTHATNLESKLYDLTKAVNDSISYAKDEIVGSIEKSFIDNEESIATIVNKALNKKSQPTYEEFMIELSRDLYSRLDFEEDIIETEQKDENGNILSKTKHKPNPINLAKKSIYRADILWQELKKKNIVN